MPKLWRGLLLFLLIFGLGSVAAHDSSRNLESDSESSTLEQSGERDDASIRIIPDKGLAGSTHTISITGLNDGEEISVRILFDGEVVYATERAADNRGRVEIEIFTELDDPIGDYIIEVLNLSGDVIAHDTLTVIEPLGLNATVIIDPLEAEAGTIFTLNFSDVQPFIDLQVLFRNADGAVVYSTLIRADVDGIARAEFPTQGRAAGIYSVSVVLERDRNVEVASGKIRVLERMISTTVEPAQIRPNRDLSISITGFEADTNASIEIKSSDVEVIYSEEISFDDTGAANLVYTVPEDIVSGDYSVNVLEDGEVVSEASFTVFVPEFAVSISPENGTVDTNFLVQISGLNEDETVIVELVGATAVLESLNATADSDGNASMLLGQSLELEVGIYAIRVVRDDIIVFGQPINISEQAIEPEKVSITVSPNSGAIPTDYTFHVEGLIPDSDLSINILFEGEPVYSTHGTSDENGIFDLIINSETGDPTGIYRFEVQAEDTLLASIDFTVSDTPTESEESSEAAETPEISPNNTTEPSIRLNPNMLVRGERLEILIKNLEANETVSVEMRYRGDVVYSRAYVSSDIGALGIAVRFEDSDPTGTYDIVVLRAEEIIANATLNVVQDASELPELQAEISISPESGPIGTDYIIEITGLKAEEALAVSLEFEGDTVLNLERSADANGKVVIVIGSELDDSPGEYMLHVLRENNTELTSRLIIEDAILMGEVERSGSPESHPSFEIMIEPDILTIGDTFDVLISGLNAGETVSISIRNDETVIFETEGQADDAGHLVFDLFTEKGDPIGITTLVVKRENGETASANFELLDADSAIEIRVEPETGPIGTEHNITITGLEANTSYEVAVEYDSKIVYTSSVDADEDGEANITLNSQEGDKFGTYNFIILGDNVELASIEFEVREFDMTGDDFSDIELRIAPESAPPATAYEISIIGLSPEQNITLLLEYQDNIIFETALTANEDGSTGITLTSKPSDPYGEYFVLILADGEVIASKPLFIVEEGNNPADTSESIIAMDGAIYYGNINADTGELIFIFSGDVGQLVMISLASKVFDTYLILQDAEGQELVSSDNDSSGSNSQITRYELPYSGDYRVVVSSADFQNEGKTVFGNFVLVIEPFSSISSDYGETNTLEFNEEHVTQFIEFEGLAGDVISVVVDSNATIDSYLTVLSPSTEQLIQNDDGGLGFDPELMHFVLPESGRYSLVIRALTPGDSGQVDVTIRHDDNHAIDTETQTVRLNSKQNRDLLLFEGHAGETVQLIVKLESGNVAALHIMAEQDGLSLLVYETGALSDSIRLELFVPDDGLVSIHVEDALTDNAVLSFTIERD